MIDADRIREATREVLARPAYDELDQTLPEQWFERARAIVADLVDAVLGTAAAGGVGQVVAVVLVAIVLVAAVLLLLGLRRRDEVETVVELADRVDAAAALADAERARASGDLHEAVRARYGALVLALAEAGVVAGRPGLTVGEVDAAVAVGAPTAAGQVGTAGRVLADVVYGHVTPTEADDDRVAAGLRAVAEATGRRDLLGTARVGGAS